MGKPDESSEQGGTSISVVLLTISQVIIVCIFPPLVILDDLDGDFVVLVFGVSAIFYMLADPLFLYVPLINEETKCVMLDNRLKIAAIVLRSCGDLRYVQRIYVRIKDGLQSHSLKKIAMRVAIDIVSILPVPQVREGF
ncbi:hypothetical protein M0R45_000394 [Rubus argutus]|uniref:Uncharacterized protein n=1 Tax=Rubus argutus TaxID=59490 RepID=A0AAW1VLW2_RUBAR